MREAVRGGGGLGAGWVGGPVGWMVEARLLGRLFGLPSRSTAPSHWMNGDGTWFDGAAGGSDSGELPRTAVLPQVAIAAEAAAMGETERSRSVMCSLSPAQISSSPSLTPRGPRRTSSRPRRRLRLHLRLHRGRRPLLAKRPMGVACKGAASGPRASRTAAQHRRGVRRQAARRVDCIALTDEVWLLHSPSLSFPPLPTPLGLEAAADAVACDH